MKDYELHLQQIADMVAESPRRFGQLWLDEELFFRNTTDLKKSLIPILGDGKHINHPRLVESIDALERVVEQGKVRLFGNVLVNPQAYEKQVQEVQTLLAQLPDREENPAARVEVQSRQILEDAHAEARRIIEDAEARVRELQQPRG
jgi:hypothetical protein